MQALRQNTGLYTTSLPCYSVLCFFKFSSSVLAQQPLNGGRPFFPSSYSGLYTLTGGKRHSGLTSSSTMENSPEILLPDDVGPGVDTIGQGADTEEGKVCPFSELARGV